MTVIVDAQDQRAYNAYKAQKSGDDIEKKVNAALNILVEDGKAAWHKTGPETKTFTAQRATATSRHKAVTKIVGKGPADRIIGYWGRAIWMEIKNIREKNLKTHRKDLHQYETMMTFEQYEFIGVYMLHWYQTQEWRFHRVTDLFRVDDGVGESGYGIILRRSQGILVPHNIYGIPDISTGLDTLCSLSTPF